MQAGGLPLVPGIQLQMTLVLRYNASTIIAHIPRIEYPYCFEMLAGGNWIFEPIRAWQVKDGSPWAIDPARCIVPELSAGGTGFSNLNLAGTCRTTTVNSSPSPLLGA